MFVTVIPLKYALLVSQRSYGHFLKLSDLILFEEHDKSSPFDAIHYIVLCPQNGDRIVAIVSLTSLHPMYSIQLKKPTRYEKRCYSGVLYRRSRNKWSRHHGVGRCKRLSRLSSARYCCVLCAALLNDRQTDGHTHTHTHTHPPAMHAFQRNRRLYPSSFTKLVAT